MKITIFLLPWVAAFILQSCGSASRFSNKKKEVKADLFVQEDPALLYPEPLQTQAPLDFNKKGELVMANRSRGIITPGLVGQVISLAIMGTKGVIAKEKKKYIAEHNQSVSHLYFYDQISAVGPFDPTGMQFKGIEFLRMVEGGDHADTALWFQFEVDMDNAYSILNNSMFHLVLKDAKIKYAKAKVPKTRWYNPFSWGNKKDDDKLNLDIEITFKSSFLTQEGEFVEDLKVGRFFLPIRGFPIDPGAPGYLQSQESLKGRIPGGFSFLIPRSAGYMVGPGGQLKGSFSQGQYSVDIKVIESGKEKFITKLAQDQTETIFKQAEKLIINNLKK